MDTIKHEALAQKFSQCRILVIGDIMLDSYLYGEASRISPEAPVPVVHIREEKHLLGGAGNVARNIASLGAQVTLVGLVGDDAHGQSLHDIVEKEGIRGILGATPGRCTTVKSRVVAQNQQMIRLDYEKVEALEQNTVRELIKLIEPLLFEHDVLIISDYAKGLVSEDFMAALRDCLANHAKNHKSLPWFADPKPQNMHLFAGATMLTPNAKELAMADQSVLKNKEDILAAGERVRKKAGVEHLLATLGAEGMALFMPDGSVWHIPAMAQDVFDVTGAGDTVIATLSLAIAAGSSVQKACMIANAAAGYAVSQFGAAVLKTDTLIKQCKLNQESNFTRWK